VLVGVELLLIAALVLFLLPPTKIEILFTDDDPASSQNEQLRLVGYVTSGQQPLADFQLSVRGRNYSQSYSHQTNPYRLTLNRSQLASDHLMITASKSDYIAARKPVLVPKDSNEISVNFTLLKGKNIVLKGYNSQKEPIGYQKLVGSDFSRYQNTFYLTNRKWEPLPAAISTQKQWLQVKTPTSENVTLHLLWPIKGFGQVLLRAQIVNGSSNSLDLNRRIAETEFKFLKRDITSFRQQGDLNSSFLRRDILPLATKAEKLLSRAKKFTMPESSVYYQKALNYTLWAGEKLYLARANSQIDDKREKVTIRVADKFFSDKSRLQLQLRQKRREFRFGWFLLHPGHHQILRYLKQLPTAYANIFAFWWQTEPLPGQFNVTPIKNRLNDLKEKKVAVSGLIGDSPTYTSKLSDRQLKKSVSRHVKHLIERFPQLGPWECYGLGMNWGADQSLQMTRGRSKRANKKTTETCIEAVNRYTDKKPIVTGWNIDGRNIGYPAVNEAPYTYFNELDRPYQIGFDFMYFGSAHEMYPGLIENEIYSIDKQEARANKIPARDLATIGRLLDRYSQLNKSMHIQYFQAPSNYNNYTLGYWHQPWNESIQAEWIKKFYKLAYGHPQVKAINYLEVHDEKWRQVKNGLLTSGGHPKQSYFTLKELLNDWRSDFNRTISQEKKEISKHLYPGEYHLSLTGGNQVMKELNISVNSSKQLLIN